VSGTFIDKFSERSDVYRRARPSYPPRLMAALAELAPSRRLAWDSGTGNGQAALGLAEHFDSVFATDPSPQQIASAVAHERVAYSVEPAEHVSLEDASADLVLAAQAMHWYDLDLFYRQAERVLRPGGILAAIGYAWFYVDAGIDAAIEQALLRPMRSYWAANNELLWDGYRSIPFPGEEIRIGQPAIHLDWSLDELMDYVLTWSATRLLEAEQGGEPLRRARAALAEAWGDPARKRHVVMPMQVRVARIG
jgi:SAM-dependent methyltransferase